MATYTVPPDLARDIRQMKLDIKTLQVKVANLGAQPSGTPGTVWDANVVWNGGIESGLTGWVRTLFAPIIVESADPLDQLRSLRVEEAAGAQTAVTWLPGGNSASPTPGNDVFATAPGDIWRLQCLARATVATTDTQLVAAMGNTAADVFALPGANTTWTTVSTVALSPNVIAPLLGNVTIPASRNFIGLFVYGAFTAPTPAWKWWLDDVALQRKLS